MTRAVRMILFSLKIWTFMATVQWAASFLTLSNVVPAYALALTSKRLHAHKNLPKHSWATTKRRHQQIHDTKSSSILLSQTVPEETAKETCSEKKHHLQVADNAKEQRTLGILVLLSVPLSWGTYGTWVTL